ncbi:cbb3-type cytochrome c oxidase subunit 3 [Viridibacterium curvum]|uniref:Cbb3-type cytochrome c oxidase subunit 3 n=1 Tax=Viridibacterium curvum TaxID=1101404 RepID=A0ABP9QBT4_9RHOO
MEDTLHLLRSVLTALALLSFLGIVAWAYSRQARKGFEEAAQLPFTEDGEEGITQQDRGAA